MQNKVNHAETLSTEVLTETQRFWLKHYQARQASGKSQVDYAREEGLSIKSLYYWNKRLHQLGVIGFEQSEVQRFKKVHLLPVQTAGVHCKILLTNGIACELSDLDALGLEQLLLTVSRLPQ